MAKIPSKIIKDSETIKKTSAFFLVAKTPFHSYKKGDRITDADEIENILSSSAKVMVLKVKRKGQ